MATIRLGKPRETVQAVFPDGRILEGPVGTKLSEFVAAAYPDPTVPAVAALVDGELWELSEPLRRDAEIRPIFMTDSEGIRIYTRSLSFLLAAAAFELFPKARLIIDHSVPFGGYYCRITGRPPFSSEELARLESLMRAWVEKDIPIEKDILPAAEAARILQSQGLQRKAELLLAEDPGQIPLYRLGNFREYLFGPMVPSTGYLRYFRLHPYHDG